MVEAYLLPACYHVEEWTKVMCLHRHSQRLPVALVRLSYARLDQEVDLVKIDNLPYPLLLGVPGFAKLLWQASGGGGEGSIGN